MPVWFPFAATLLFSPPVGITLPFVVIDFTLTGAAIPPVSPSVDTDSAPLAQKNNPIGSFFQTRRSTQNRLTGRTRTVGRVYPAAVQPDDEPGSTTPVH